MLITMKVKHADNDISRIFLNTAIHTLRYEIYTFYKIYQIYFDCYITWRPKVRAHFAPHLPQPGEMWLDYRGVPLRLVVVGRW